MSIDAFYTPANDYLVIETGQPQDSVRIGRGRTLSDAIRDARGESGGTPIQCTGRDSGTAAALAWGIDSGWITQEEWDDAVGIDPERVTAALGRVAETAWMHEG